MLLVQELESKLAGIDLNKMEGEDMRLQRTLHQLAQAEATIAEHSKERRELEAKLAWYVDNQELLNSDEEKLKSKDDLIRMLQQRLEFYNANDKLDGKPHKVGKNSSGVSSTARVRELEAKVRELEAALLSRKEDSIAALVAAAKPSSEENQMIETLRKEVKGLKEARAAKEAQAERKLRALRQEYDKVKLDYEKRLRVANEQRSGSRNALHDSTNSKGSSNNLTRIKELERQIDDIRTYYNKKIKSLSEQLEGQHLNEKSSKNDGKGSTSERNLEDFVKQLASKSKRIRVLERQLDEMSNQLIGVSKEPTNHSPLPDELRDMKSHIESLTGDLQILQTKFEASEMARDSMQKAYTGAVEKLAVEQVTHKQQLQKLHDEHSKEVAKLHLEHDSKVQSQDPVASKEKMDALERELEQEREAANKLKIERDNLHEKLANSDHESSKTLAQPVKDASDQDLKQQTNLLKDMHRKEMDAKNAQIEQFQRKLENILSTATALHSKMTTSTVVAVA